jgi:hypothetical protein
MMTPRGHSSLLLPPGQFLMIELAMPTKTAITNLLNLSETKIIIPTISSVVPGTSTNADLCTGIKFLDQPYYQKILPSGHDHASQFDIPYIESNRSRQVACNSSTVLRHSEDTRIKVTLNLKLHSLLHLK